MFDPRNGRERIASRNEIQRRKRRQGKSGPGNTIRSNLASHSDDQREVGERVKVSQERRKSSLLISVFPRRLEIIQNQEETSKVTQSLK